MDPRVERLDAAVEHLREAGDRRDVGDGQAGRRAGRARCRRWRRARSRGRRDRGRGRPGPVLSETDEQRPARTGSRHPRPRWRDRRRAGRLASAQRAGEQPSRRPRGSSRCSTGWIRAASASSSSPGRTGTASWATIGPPSSVASTRWTVTPVTATPAASASRDAVQARERRQQRRVDVEDPAGEGGRGPPARRAAGSRRGRRRPGATADAAVSASDPRRRRRGTRIVVDPLLRRPVERRARAVGEHEHDVAAQRAAPRRGDQRPQVGPGPRDPDRDASAVRPRSCHPPRTAPPIAAASTDLADDARPRSGRRQPCQRRVAAAAAGHDERPCRARR